MFPDAYYYMTVFLQAMLCAFYIGSLISYRITANKELVCLLAGALLSAGVIAADELSGVRGAAVLILPVIMLAFSVLNKGGVLIKLLASTVPLAAATALNYICVEYVHFDKGSYFYMKFVYEPELFICCSTVYIQLLVSFTVIAGLITGRRSIGSYSIRLLLTLTLFSTFAVCLLFYIFVSDVTLFYLLPMQCFFGVLSSALCMHIYHITKQQSIQRELEDELRLARLNEHYSRQYSESMKQQYAAVRSMKHDMRNSFLTVAELIRDGEYDSAYRFAKENSDAPEALQAFADTGSSVADAVINSKLSYAAGLGISTRCLSVSRISGISDIDLCSLLGNALDNAVTACAALPPDTEREISLEISCDNGRFYTFTVKNTVASSVLESNPELLTTKDDSTSHGLGTKIIRDIAKRSGGRVDLYEEDGMFCCRIAVIAACEK